jgi:plastocyanin
MDKPAQHGAYRHILHRRELFQSGNCGTDGTFSHTFDTAGNFPYFCEIHPWMVGVITVGSGSASSGVSDTGGDPGY